MFFVDTLETEGLGNRSYLAGGQATAVVVDPPRDVERVLAGAAARGVRIAYVAETWVATAPFTGAAILGAWDGKRLAARVSGGRLQRLFAWVLLAVAAFMLADAPT